MTQQRDSDTPQGRDRPVLEITEEMIEAGMRALHESGIVASEFENDSNRLTVAEVLLAALRGSPIHFDISLDRKLAYEIALASL